MPVPFFIEVETQMAEFSHKIFGHFSRLNYEVEIERGAWPSPCGQCERADDHVGQAEFTERVDNLNEALLKNGRAGAAVWQDEFSGLA